MAAMVPPGTPSGTSLHRPGDAPEVPPGNCPPDNPPTMPVGMGMMGSRAAMGPPPPSGKGKVPPSGKGGPPVPPGKGGKPKKGVNPFPPKGKGKGK